MGSCISFSIKASIFYHDGYNIDAILWNSRYFFALTDGKISYSSLTDASEKVYQNLLTAGVAGWELI